jgi:predicted O-methyltransferase YrrM
MALVQERYHNNIIASGRAGQTTTYCDTSASVLPSLPDLSFDFIYVDGSHEAGDVFFDGLEAHRLINYGGIIIFDDYQWTEPIGEAHKPAIAIEAFLALKGYAYQILTKNYQVIVKRL